MVSKLCENGTTGNNNDNCQPKGFLTFSRCIEMEHYAKNG